MLQMTLIQDLNNIIPIGWNSGILCTGSMRPSASKGRFSRRRRRIPVACITAAFLAGAGISQPTGRKSSMNITFLWSVTGNEYGFYDTPEIRIEFYF
jgi:hypothetical protein